MAQAPCTADTNSIDLELDGSGNLVANLRKHPAGALVEDGSGVYVGLSGTSGLAIASDRLTIDADGDGIGLNAGGTSKVNNFTYAGWVPYVGDDGVTHNAAINRAAYAQVGASIRLGPHTVPQSSATIVRYNFTWRGTMQCNYPALGETANILDSVNVYLQASYDFGAWTDVDKATMVGMDSGISFQLQGSIAATEGGAVAHYMDARLITFGGYTSGTARQGVLGTSYHRGITKWW